MPTRQVLPFERVHTGDDRLERIQDNIAAVLDPVVALLANRANNALLTGATLEELLAAIALKLDAAGYNAADVLAKLLTVDGATSLLDADKLDGEEGAFYRNASNINAGTLAEARIDPAIARDSEVTAAVAAHEAAADPHPLYLLIADLVAAFNAAVGTDADLLEGENAAFYTLISQPIAGLVPSNAADATNDITLSAGYVIASDGTVARLASAMTKRADAPWAQGTDNGGMFTGSFSATTTYHCIVIRQDSDGAVDWGYDTDPAGANKPSGWTVIGRAFSKRSVAGPAWGLFDAKEIGGMLDVTLRAKAVPLANYAASTSRQTVAMGHVPSDIETWAKLAIWIKRVSGTGNTHFWVESTSFTDVAPDDDNSDAGSITGTADSFGAIQKNVWTNTARTIAHRQGTTNAELTIRLNGWIDPRRAA